MIYNKGGKTCAHSARRLSADVKPRRRYSNREKALVLGLVDEKMKAGKISFGRAVADLALPRTTVFRWRADARLPNLLADSSSNSSSDGEKLQYHSGPEGFLEEIKEELIECWRNTLGSVPMPSSSVDLR